MQRATSALFNRSSKIIYSTTTTTTQSRTYTWRRLTDYTEDQLNKVLKTKVPPGFAQRMFAQYTQLINSLHK
jgi:hypothetical protein